MIGSRGPKGPGSAGGGGAALAWALGPKGAAGGPGPGGGALGWGRAGPQNHEIEQPACLDPSPASWSRNPATRDQGARGGGPDKP